MYVLVLSCNPLIAYIYDDGIVRIATENYEPANAINKKNMYKHLTNYAVNKNHENFFKQGKKEDEPLESSYKKSINEVFGELKKKGLAMDYAWREIKDACAKTILSVQPVLKHNYNVAHTDDPYSQICFEVLGLDILLDCKLRPHLLEVNHAPSFTCDTAVDQKIKKGLIEDTLRMLNCSKLERQRLIDIKNNQKKQTLSKGRREHLCQGEFRENCLKEREEFLSSSNTSYQRIFPSQNDELNKIYQELLEQAEENYKTLTGVAIFKRPKMTTPWVSKNKLFNDTDETNQKEFNFESIKKIYGKQQASFTIKSQSKKRHPEPFNTVFSESSGKPSLKNPLLRTQTRDFDRVMSDFKKQIELSRYMRTTLRLQATEATYDENLRRSSKNSYSIQSKALNSSYDTRRPAKTSAPMDTSLLANNKSPYGLGFKMPASNY